MPSTNLTTHQYITDAWTKPSLQRSALDSAVVISTAVLGAAGLFMAVVGLMWLRSKLRQTVLGRK